MNRADSRSKLWYLAPFGIVALLVAIVLISLRPLQPHETILKWFIRGAALLGYQAIFLSIVSSLYMRQMLRWFGRPFVRVHHILSVTGLALIVLHPIGVAWDSLSIAVFVPAVDSWISFFTNGGRVAWYLFAIASLAALLRKGIGQNWRLIHYLTYVAFWMASAHALLLGTNTQYVAVRVVASAMATTTLAILVQKRVQAGRRQAAKARKPPSA